MPPLPAQLDVLLDRPDGNPNHAGRALLNQAIQLTEANTRFRAAMEAVTRIIERNDDDRQDTEHLAEPDTIADNQARSSAYLDLTRAGSVIGIIGLTPVLLQDLGHRLLIGEPLATLMHLLPAEEMACAGFMSFVGAVASFVGSLTTKEGAAFGMAFNAARASMLEEERTAKKCARETLSTFTTHYPGADVRDMVTFMELVGTHQRRLVSAIEGPSLQR